MIQVTCGKMKGPLLVLIRRPGKGTSLEQIDAEPVAASSLQEDERPDSRRAPRVTLATEILCSGEAGSARSSAGDLSVGGMFVELTRLPFRPRDIVKIAFALPGSADRIEARSEVRYIQEGIGMGVQFLEIRPADLERVARFVAAAEARKTPKRDEEMRRGARVSVKVPVILRGLADGSAFEELTEIVTLSKNGACLMRKGPLQVGMKVRILTPKGQEFMASVVWLGDASRPQTREQFGVQTRGLAHALGFRFP